MLSKIALLTLVSTAAAQPSTQPKGGEPKGGTTRPKIPDPVTEKMPCTCMFGEAATGQACKGSYVPMCASCDEGYVLRGTICAKGCMTTKNIAPVCCNGNDYENPSKAICGGCRSIPKPGTCNSSCDWPDHDQKSCDNAEGCAWAAGKGINGMCGFEANTGGTLITCKATAMAALIDTPDLATIAAKFETFHSALKSCKPPFSGPEIADLRKMAAIAANTVNEGDYKKIMNIAANKDLTKEELQDQEQSKFETAGQAFAKSCSTCINGAQPVEATCLTNAVTAFKTAFGANPPKDDVIKSSVRRYAAQFAGTEQTGCKVETSQNKKNQCRESAALKNFAASCKIVDTTSVTAKTEFEESRKDLANEAISGTCAAGKNKLDCLKDRKAALEELGEDVTTTQVIDRMKDIAAEKAFDFMRACTKTMDFTEVDASVVKAARVKCFTDTKAEYQKYDDKPAMKDTELGAILNDVGIKKSSDVFALCMKGGGGKAKCVGEARQEVADATGLKNDDTTIPINDFLAKLEETAGLIASKKKNDCLAAGSTVLECKGEFKKELADRKGVAQDKIDDKKLAEAERHREEEEATKSIKAFIEDQKSKALCTKDAAVCVKDKRDALGEALRKKFGKDTAPSDIEVEEYKRRAVDEGTKKVEESCRSQGTSKADCDVSIKAAIKDITGKDTSDEELDLAKEHAKGKALREYAEQVSKDSSLTKDQKKAARLDKLKELSGNTNLKEEDLKVEEDKAAKSKIADLLSAAGTTADLDIKEAIKAQTGVDTVDDYTLARFKKKALAANMKDVFKTGSDAGMTKEDRDIEFKKKLRSQLDLADDADIELKAAEYKRYAKQDAIKDVIEATKIPRDANDGDRKKAVDAKLAAVKNAMKTVDGVEPKMYEAEKQMKKLATKATLDLAKSMSFTGANGKIDKQKQTDNFAKIKKAYEEKTGKKDYDMYKIKGGLKEASLESDEIQDVMKQAGKTEAEKKVLFKQKFEEMTGDDKVTDPEVEILIKKSADKNMFKKIKDRATARGGKAPTTAADKIAEKDARNAAFQNARGRAPKNDAEGKKSFEDALTEEGGNDYFTCMKSSSSKTAAMKKSDCATGTADKYSDLGFKLDKDAIFFRAKEAEKTSAVGTASDCRKEKTDDECFLEVKKAMKENRGGVEIKDYEAKKVLGDGAEKQISTVMSACTAKTEKACRDAAFEDYKKKALAPKMTKDDFAIRVKSAASKEALGMAQACDKSDATSDCKNVVLEAFKSSRGKKDDTKIKVADAVSACNKAFKEEAADIVKTCQGTKTECWKKVKDKMKATKTWDKQTGDDAVITDAAVASSITKGAVVSAKNTFKSCIGLSKDVTDKAVKKEKKRECKVAFKTEFIEAFPDLKTKPDDAKAMKKVKKAQKAAQREAAGEFMAAKLESTDTEAADFKPKTRAEIHTMLKAALLDSAPMDDETELENPLKLEDVRQEAGMEKVANDLRTCKELGDDCKISRDVYVKPTSRLATAEAKLMRLGEAEFKASGKSLEGLKPKKVDERKAARKAAKHIAKKAISACMDAETKPEKMKECLEADVKKVGEMAHDDTTHTDTDIADSLKDDALNEVKLCMDVKGAKIADCKKKFDERLLMTETDHKSPTKEEVEKKKPIETAIKKLMAAKMDLKSKIGKLATKVEEKTARDELKKDLIKYGLPERKADLALQKGVMLKVIADGADAVKAGKTDDEVIEVIKTKMKECLDAPDFDEKVESQEKYIKLAKAMAAGGKAGDLKFKKMKRGVMRMTMTSEKKTFTEDDLKKMVTMTSEKIIDVEKIVVTEKPKKDEVTKRTCGTMTFPPKAGKTSAEVVEAIEGIKKLVRRALRQLSDDEATTSTDEEETIVTGDDDSEAKEPEDASANLALIIGLLVGGLVLVALVVALAVLININFGKKKDKNGNTPPKYTPHHEL